MNQAVNSKGQKMKARFDKLRASFEREPDNKDLIKILTLEQLDAIGLSILWKKNLDRKKVGQLKNVRTKVLRAVSNADLASFFEPTTTLNDVAGTLRYYKRSVLADEVEEWPEDSI